MKFESDPLNLLIGGVGGQGNILLSRMLSRVLSRKGYFVNIGETFGAAQRGGAVFSSMRISKKKNYGPLIPAGHAHIILSLEPLETLRILLAYGNPSVKTISNIEPLYPVGVLSKKAKYPDLKELQDAIKSLSGSYWFLDATRLALELNSPVVANIVMLGALVAVGVLPVIKEEVQEEIKNSFPSTKVQLNLEAFELGLKAVGQNA